MNDMIMKEKLILVLLAGASFALSCGEDPAPSDNPGTGEETAPVTLQLRSETVTKTVLGDEEDGAYRVWWTDGDRICVNGVKSSMLIGAGQKALDGEFTVKGVKPPYHVV